MAPYGESLDSERNPEDPNNPATPSSSTPAQPLSRREWRNQEAKASGSKELAVVKKAVEPVGPAARVAPAAAAQVATRPSSDVVKARPAARKARFKRPTKKGAVSVVVMTFAAALIATMALPAYAFGGGGNFSGGVATDGEL
ncbi:MAG: hypothetical protein Q7T71_17515, partial [Herbiconiux sp.]|nr:hypothetical protein [Herbiconiux sp.]